MSLIAGFASATPTVSSGRTHAYHQYTVRVTDEFAMDRAELAERLKGEGIGTGVYYPKPLHLYPHIAALGFKEGDFPVAEAASREVLALPVHPKVSEADAQHIVSTIKELAG